MIILEGPDGSGKSTTAKRLYEILLRQWPLHNIGPSPKTIRDVRLSSARCVLRAGQHCIQDRCTPISDWVYSRVFMRDYSPDEGEQRLWLDSLIKRQPLIILCRPDIYSPIHDPQQGDTPEYSEKVTANMEALIDQYDQLFFSSPLSEYPRTLVYNYLKNDLESFFYEHISAHIPRPA